VSAPRSPRARGAARRRAAARRRRALAATAFVAAVAGAAVGAGSSDGDGSAPKRPDPSTPPDSSNLLDPSTAPDSSNVRDSSNLSELSDGQLAGERVVTGFKGTHPPAPVRQMIRAGRLAGVILFADNFDSASGARAVARRLQSIKRPPGLRSPLLVMVDQEGGEVKRLPGPPAGSAAAMGARGPDYCRRQGTKTGRLLRGVGINVDLAPVLDVARQGSAIGAEHRAFGHRAKSVSSRANAFAAGLAGTRVAATAKHFPGLGAAPRDTDVAVQRIDMPTAKLRAIDERPYRRFIAARGPMVMVSTAIYPRLSGLPAALSRAIATGELRDRLGFRGVSISDSLETTSARAVGGPTRLARLGASAGTDLLLYTSPSDALAATRELTRNLRSGRLGHAGFRASAARVLALRSSLPG
jgi:beta-N-acetylhexosaminidase